ncbi:MAG TPA: PAS domain S-box protein, partial [Thermoanaerobaculia bacterium]|nr:PAS domain S-box protein [Thermoanaerobaculia bacterium]
MIDAVDARYRALFETTPDGIMIVNDEGVYIDLNDAMCAMLGASREELIGRHFRDFMPDGRIDDAVAAFGELRERGGLAVEFPVRRADGTFLSLEWRSRANFLPGLHLCIARDVSALRESEERYRAFVANSTEAIWRFELEVGAPVALPIDEQIEHWYQHAYLAECNEAMARMYGFASAAEIAGARMGQMLVREDPNNIAYLRAFAESGYRLIGAESHEVDRDGNEKYFVNNLIGIVENGFLVRAWGTQRDVTEQHAIESARSALLDRLEFLADVSALLGASLDYDETLRATAQAAVPRFADWCFIDVMNVTGEMERVAAQPSDPQDALEPAAKIVVPLIARGRTVGALTFANSESGRTFTEEHVRLAEDIGRRAGLAIDNARLYSELERANRAKDEFLAMLSHELRTPMTATLGWATMLKLGNMPQDMLATAAESIAQSTRAQARLVDDLLDISRIV